MKKFTKEELAQHKRDYEKQKRDMRTRKRLCHCCGKPVVYKVIKLIDDMGRAVHEESRRLRWCYKHYKNTLSTDPTQP